MKGPASTSKRPHGPGSPRPFLDVSSKSGQNPLGSFDEISTNGLDRIHRHCSIRKCVKMTSRSLLRRSAGSVAGHTLVFSNPPTSLAPDALRGFRLSFNGGPLLTVIGDAPRAVPPSIPPQSGPSWQRGSEVILHPSCRVPVRLPLFPCDWPTTHETVVLDVGVLRLAHWVPLRGCRNDPLAHDDFTLEIPRNHEVFSVRCWALCAKTRPIEIRNEIGHLSHRRCATDRSNYPVCSRERLDESARAPRLRARPEFPKTPCSSELIPCSRSQGICRYYHGKAGESRV